MTSTVRRLAFSYPANIILIATAGGSLFAFVDGIVSPHIKDASSLAFRALGFLSLSYWLFLYWVFIGSAVFLLRRKWFSALCYFAAACMGLAWIYASLALKGDRFTFTAGSHREIADIYDQRRPEFDLTNSTPHLVALDNQCRPPAGCECWVLVDPAHTSGVEKEIGGWHRPEASVFPTSTTPEHFAIVDVQRLESDAYSVVGCDMDPTAWWIR